LTQIENGAINEEVASLSKSKVFFLNLRDFLKILKIKVGRITTRFGNSNRFG